MRTSMLARHERDSRPQNSRFSEKIYDSVTQHTSSARSPRAQTQTSPSAAEAKIDRIWMRAKWPRAAKSQARSSLWTPVKRRSQHQPGSTPLRNRERPGRRIHDLSLLSTTSVSGSRRPSLEPPRLRLHRPLVGQRGPCASADRQEAAEAPALCLWSRRHLVSRARQSVIGPP
jgi:hypothetical protein